MSVATNRFYGASTKRKLIHIEKTLNENAKRLRTEKIPKEFKPRIDGPSVGWKTFFRQQDAFNYARSKASDLHVFSYESESLGTDTGQRMFLVASYPEFWHFYRQLDPEKKTHYEIIPEDPEKKTHYEIIPEGSVCKLYFDLEFSREHNAVCDGSTLTKVFIKYVCAWLEEIYKFKCSEDCILNLDASTNKKFSRHLIFQLRKTAFKDNIHAGNFVKFILQKLKEEINRLKQNLSDVLDFDESTESSTENTENTSELPLTAETNVDRRSSVMDRFTEEDILAMIVKDKNNEETLFCDHGVYTKNRNFRLYLSRKFGKNNPLVVSEDNRYRPSSHPVNSYDHQIFNDSLIVNVEYSPSLRILEFGSEGKFCNKFSNGGALHKKSDKSEDVVDGYTKSPYPEIDDFISSTLTLNGKKGRIRHWTYFCQGEIIMYDIVGYRYCHNIGREHRSNNIMLLADLKKGVYYQKCYDPDCKSMNYKSPDMDIPKEKLPSFYFEDSFDELDEGLDDMDILNAVMEAEKSMEENSETDNANSKN